MERIREILVEQRASETLQNMKVTVRFGASKKVTKTNVILTNVGKPEAIKRILPQYTERCLVIQTI